MEEYGARVVVEVTEPTKGKYDYFISGTRELSLAETRGILVGALHLCIVAEESPSEQGQALREVIDFLESEFISTDQQDISYLPKGDDQD